jgi:hypothetical protein
VAVNDVVGADVNFQPLKMANTPKGNLRRAVLHASSHVDGRKAAGAEMVEALEKAQTKAIEQGCTACELFDEVTALRQRIAELESRTVKLPDLRQIVSGDRYVWSVITTARRKGSAAAAGIKVEQLS